MKTLIVKIHNNEQQLNEISVITKDGQPTVIDAIRRVNYEFFDESIGYAPNHIITKRVEDDLIVSFEQDGVEPDLIIKGFYDNDEQGLVGISEEGQYYYYIPDTGEVADYVTQLAQGDVEGQALGGEDMVVPLWMTMPTGLPWWSIGAGGLLLAGGAAALASSDGDDKDNKPVKKTIEAVDDGSVQNPYIIMAEDSNFSNIKILGNDKNSSKEALIVTDASSPDGSVTINDDGTLNFTPNANFNGPTTITYTIRDREGKSEV